MTVRLSPDDLRNLRWLARRHGQTLDEYLVRTLRAPISDDVRAQRQQAETYELISHHLEHHMAREDKTLDRGFFVEEPEPTRPAPVADLPAEIQALRVQGPVRGAPHSCHHCLPERLRHAAESRGTCNAPEQRGRPCHFPSGSAESCPFYVARVQRPTRLRLISPKS